MREYFITPKYLVAKNLKSASRSISKAIFLTYHVNDYPDTNSALPEEERWNDSNLFLSLTPQTSSPEEFNLPCVILFRNPVERFKSAVISSGLTLEQALNELENNIHFIHQTSFKIDQAFRFESEIDEFCDFIGVPPLDEKIGENEYKISLSKDQEKFIKEFYKTDIEFYESI